MPRTTDRNENPGMPDVRWRLSDAICNATSQNAREGGGDKRLK